MALFDMQEQGFLLLRGVFGPGLLADVRNYLYELVDYAENDYEDPFERYYLRHRADQGVLYDLYQRHPIFYEFVRNKTILSCLAEVMGQNIFMYENSLVYKPRGRKNGVPFHQDFVSRNNEPTKYIAWMAIDDVTKESGALKVIPGSHKSGFRTWYRVKGETHHDRVKTDGLNMDGIEHIEMAAGDVLIFNQLVVHGSDEAHTDSMRFVYRVSYQGFDEIYTPRGTPIVVHGGGASELKRMYSVGRGPVGYKKLSRHFLRKIGRKLARL